MSDHNDGSWKPPGDDSPPPPPPNSVQQPPQQPAGRAPQPPPPPGQQPFPDQPYGHVPGPSTPATRTRTPGVTAGALIMLGGAILAGLGSVLPWLSFDGFGGGDPPNGFETYPFLVADDFDPVVWTNPGAYIVGAYAVLAVLAVIMLAAGKSTWVSVCGILAALIGAAISLAAIASIADLVNTFRDLDLGAGIVLIGLAAVVAFVGSLITAIAR